ncbi:nuclear transport factor 2 family protein [Actinoplanes sp. NBC_00393]|uniref:nuclear transport factor 2 family protein n=1 Tax=Actinoplanes sp. NBC_00393 TaxID=2975953 RepID=UPI002E1F1BFC
MANSDVVRTAFDAYLRGDEATARPLYADEFTFTSPQDDHIDREAFFDRCFPTASRVKRQEIRYLLDLDEDNVFVLYEYELAAGGRFHNTEVITVRHGRITETQVFFGGPPSS